MKLVYAVVAYSLCISAPAQSIQETSEDSKTTTPGFKSLLQMGLAVEQERRPNIPLAFEYCISAGAQRKYFFGIGLDAARRESTKPDYSYNDHTGKLSNSVSLYSFHLSQKYIFSPGDKISPFIGLNVGVRTLSQDIFFKYTTIVSPLFPIPVSVRENIYASKQHSLNVTASAGLFFRLNEIAGIVSSIGIRSSKAIEMYEGTRKPTCAVFTIGLVVGGIGSKSRKSIAATPEQKTQPKPDKDSDGF